MFHRNDIIDSSNTLVQPRPSDALFLVNPRNEDFARGHADTPAREPATGCMLLFLMPFVLAGIVVAVWTFVQWRDWAVLSVSGTSTTGYFTDRTTSESDDRTTYHASYRYVVNDYEYTRKEQVSYDLYSRAEIGGSTPVLYFTGDPTIATLDLAYGNTMRLFLTIFTLFWDGFVGLVVGGIISGMLKDAYLAKTGRVTFGQLTELRSRYDSDNDYQIEVKYAFNSPTSGSLVRSQHKFQDNSRKNKTLPKAGANVAVWYSDDKTYRLL